VFTTQTGEPCDPSNALRALKVEARGQGSRTPGCTHLRHSAASMMLTSNGVPLKVVSEILDHSWIAITGDVNGHIASEVARGAMDVLGAAFG
jgi:site-specific recombinase XerD